MDAFDKKSHFHISHPIDSFAQKAVPAKYSTVLFTMASVDKEVVISPKNSEHRSTFQTPSKVA